jgi:hypothetical protein
MIIDRVDIIIYMYRFSGRLVGQIVRLPRVAWRPETIESDQKTGIGPQRGPRMPKLGLR